MVQEDRFEVMDDFRKGKFRYLVATDVAARELILIILHMLLIMIFHLKRKLCTSYWKNGTREIVEKLLHL